MVKKLVKNGNPNVKLWLLLEAAPTTVFGHLRIFCVDCINLVICEDKRLQSS